MGYGPGAPLPKGSGAIPFCWPIVPAQRPVTTLRPACLERHVLRMLVDERSAAFVDDFVDSWLALRDIGLLPPPRHVL